LKKIILIVILSILLVSFGVFIFNAYLLQKNYFKQKESEQISTEVKNEEVVVNLSAYTDYTGAEYEKALNDERIILLYFTSNWCSECAKQDKIITEVFNEFSSEGIMGLKIHILDSETTFETDALAQKFDITKEQSFVALDKSGKVAFKHVGTLSGDLLKQKMQEVILK